MAQVLKGVFVTQHGFIGDALADKLPHRRGNVFVGYAEGSGLLDEVGSHQETGLVIFEVIHIGKHLVNLLCDLITNLADKVRHIS